STGFLFEFIHLFAGIIGNSYIYREEERLRRGKEEFHELKGREAGIFRSDQLDDLAAYIGKYFKKYPSGLEKDVSTWRKRNRKRILEYFGGSEEDWEDYKWHLKNVIRDAKTLKELVEITPDQEESINLAISHRIPFGITPYYLSLMDRKMSLGYDHAIRAQVIPPLHYVREVIKHKEDRGQTLDFMGEHDTSPHDLITRRYPMVAILKPFNTCSQICVYCQRNWELDSVLDEHAEMGKKRIDEALDWFAEHPTVSDVLVTGGDPAIMTDERLDHIFGRLAEMNHVQRIRLGTRTPVVLPMRINKGFAGVLKKYHKPGIREFCVVTHFEHPYEISHDSLKAIERIKKLGISVYNQEVFTLENSRRFETAKLRRDLRLIGVDPYYTFNMKGKDETRNYHVPIARLMQERKEEARLLPGIDRTDEPVFNVPRLGKNHLMRWQDHRLVMIRPDGSRVYEFHPWEKNIQQASTYLYTDVPILEFLVEMERRGEDKQEYRTIWYYF
ncbi:MAG: KamA family radical SAM protein, partial [Candidatus Glassbacteria bacterium]